MEFCRVILFTFYKIEFENVKAVLVKLKTTIILSEKSPLQFFFPKI